MATARIGTSRKGVQPIFYRPFTTAYDEVISARDLIAEDGLDPEEIRAQGKLVDYNTLMGYDRVLLPDVQNNELLRAQLQVDLWKRIASVKSSDMLVTLLIAQGGYLNDSRRRTVATTVLALGDTFSNLRVPFEVAGHTTKGWRGGESAQAWVAAGKPLPKYADKFRTPGRLNDLRFIIYKGAEQSWHDERPYIGLLAGEAGRELCKENIDGEALAWARDRALKRPEKKRLIISIGNESPCDDATNENSPPGYLARHLDSVIGRIRDKGEVRLASIRLLPRQRTPEQLKSEGDYPPSRYRHNVDVHFGERPLEKILARADRLALQLTRA